jgi:hypothetical protein
LPFCPTLTNRGTAEISNVVKLLSVGNTGQAGVCALQASLLHYAKGLGQAAADGVPVVDVVLTVSSVWQSGLQHGVAPQVPRHNVVESSTDLKYSGARVVNIGKV